MYNEGKKAFDTSAAVVAKRVLQLASAGTVSHNTATATNSVIGVSEYAAASGDMVGVVLMTIAGTVEVTAGAAIAKGNDVFAAADGKVTVLPVGAGTYRRIGLAVEAATADGDVIEVMLDSGYTTETVV